MKPELKPCPFCGENENLIVQHCEGTIIHPAYRIYCGNCGASSGYADRVDPAKYWNSRAALASPEVQGLRWRPIDTAPMDGSTILIGRFNSHGKWRTMRGQWMGEEYIAQNWEDPDDVEHGWFETSVEADDTPNCWRIIEPTHWMPLPAPPADTTTEILK